MEKYRILVADDEPIERQVVNKKINGYFPDQVEVFLAENGLQAVDLYEEKDCQIAILDIAMPGMTGLEAAKVIRSRHNNARIIFLTAYDDFSYAKKAIEVRALDYLLKPGSDEDIINVLEQAFMLCDAAKERQAKEKTGALEAEHKVVDSNSVTGNTISANAVNVNVPDNAADADSPNVFIRKVRGYIEENYQADIALQDIAGNFGYSDVYFCKLFKQNFDMNFIAYLNEYRVDIAKKLLADPEINIKDISVKAGYRDANYFTRIFKRKTGMTPSEYRSGVMGS